MPEDNGKYLQISREYWEEILRQAQYQRSDAF
jgi:hypothetical protein